MRIVLDTKSKAWAQFVNIIWGTVILFVILIAFRIIQNYIEYDLEFIKGCFAGTHMSRYKWKV